jgi:hypothetical protein
MASRIAEERRVSAKPSAQVATAKAAATQIQQEAVVAPQPQSKEVSAVGKYLSLATPKPIDISEFKAKEGTDERDSKKAKASHQPFSNFSGW